MKARPIFQRKDIEYKYAHLPHNYVWKINDKNMFFSMDYKTWQLHQGQLQTHTRMIAIGWQSISQHDLAKLYPELVE